MLANKVKMSQRKLSILAYFPVTEDWILLLNKSTGNVVAPRISACRPGAPVVNSVRCSWLIKAGLNYFLATLLKSRVSQSDYSVSLQSYIYSLCLSPGSPSWLTDLCSHLSVRHPLGFQEATQTQYNLSFLFFISESFCLLCKFDLPLKICHTYV